MTQNIKEYHIVPAHVPGVNPEAVAYALNTIPNTEPSGYFSSAQIENWWRLHGETVRQVLIANVTS